MIRALVVAVLVTVAVAGAVAFLVLFKFYRIPTSAMEPTLHCARPAQGCEARFSDRVAALRVDWPFDEVERGDVVVFATPPLARERCGAGGAYVKRVIALPGERWEERRGVVYVDGRRLREPYLQPERRDAQSYPARRVPARSYFVLGDNRKQSCDSRIWGPVPRKNLTAKVVATYWPPKRIGFR